MLPVTEVSPRRVETAGVDIPAGKLITEVVGVDIPGDQVIKEVASSIISSKP